MNTAGKRVRYIRNTLGVSMEKFGEPLGVTRASISNIENGRRNLTRKMANLISKNYNVSVEWLLTGNGTTFEPINKEKSFLINSGEEFEKLEKVLVAEYLRTDPDERKIFLKYLRNIINGLGTTISEPSQENSEEASIDDKVARYRAELEIKEVLKMINRSITNQKYDD